MNDIDLKKKAEELELRLNLQLQQFKNDSQVYVLGGGIALVTGLISYGIIKRSKRKKKKNRIKSAAAAYKSAHIAPEIDRTPESERKGKKRASRSSSLVSTIKKRLLFSLLSFGQAKLVDELNRRRSN